MYFGSINHQDNSCPGFPAAKSGTAALLMVFQGVAGAPGKLFTERLEDKFPFQYFKSSKNFLFLWSFDKTTWSIELRRAEVGSGWWTATKKVNLISRDCNQEEWGGGTSFSKHAITRGSVRVVRVCNPFQEARPWENWKRYYLWHSLDNLMRQSNAKKSLKYFQSRKAFYFVKRTLELWSNQVIALGQVGRA